MVLLVERILVLVKEYQVYEEVFGFPALPRDIGKAFFNAHLFLLD